MKKLLIIEGDWNDGDYVTRISQVGERELKKLLPIIKKLKAEQKDADRRKHKYYHDNYRHNYYTLTADEWDIFDEYMPAGYEQSCHTLVSVQLLEVSKQRNLY